MQQPALGRPSQLMAPVSASILISVGVSRDSRLPLVLGWPRSCPGSKPLPRIMPSHLRAREPKDLSSIGGPIAAKARTLVPGAFEADRDSAQAREETTALSGRPDIGLSGGVVCPFTGAGRQKPGKSSGQRGFTLLELMVTVAVATVLAVTAVPSMVEMIRNNRLAGDVNEFVSALNLARSEAVRRATAVTVCKSADGASCGGNWEDGWIVFVDPNNDGTHDVGENLVRAAGSLELDETLRGSANVASRITFSANGFAAGTNGTLRLCDPRGASSGRAIIVATTGLVRLGEDSSGNGIVEDNGGSDISCP